MNSGSTCKIYLNNHLTGTNMPESVAETTPTSTGARKDPDLLNQSEDEMILNSFSYNYWMSMQQLYYQHYYSICCLYYMYSWQIYSQQLQTNATLNNQYWFYDQNQPANTASVAQTSPYSSPQQQAGQQGNIFEVNGRPAVQHHQREQQTETHVQQARRAGLSSDIF